MASRNHTLDVLRYPYRLDPHKVELLSNFAFSREWRRELKRKQPSVYAELIGAFDEGRANLIELVGESTHSYNAEGLNEALDSGRLTLHRFQHTTVDGILSAITQDRTWDLKGEIDDLTQEYADKTLATLGTTTYPIFDPEISGVISQLVEENLILPTPSARARSKHGGLASDLLQRLPSFESASIDVVLDIRRELDGPLGRFRKAVASYSAEIETESWTPAFRDEAERIFEERVKDSVDEIDDEVKSNNAVRKFIARAGIAGAVSAAGVFQVFVSSSAAIDAIAAVLWGAGSATVAETKRRSDNAETSKNQLYFYYAARQALNR